MFRHFATRGIIMPTWSSVSVAVSHLVPQLAYGWISTSSASPSEKLSRGSLCPIYICSILVSWKVAAGETCLEIVCCRLVSSEVV